MPGTAKIIHQSRRQRKRACITPHFLSFHLTLSRMSLLSGNTQDSSAGVDGKGLDVISRKLKDSILFSYGAIFEFMEVRILLR
jgi:hypothetical protein